jgi:hypothetical protein
MIYITLDWETFYGQDYTLSKMTPVEYILDPRFEVIMLGVKVLGREPFVLPPDKIQAFFDLLDPQNTAIISHNSLFDACITAWHYGFVPKLNVDTLGICRAMLSSQLRSISLANVAAHLQLGAKGTAVHSAKNMRYVDIIARGMWQSYANYCMDDCRLCEGIFSRFVLSGEFPANELVILDMVLRMAVVPQFIIDDTELAAHYSDIIAEKAALLQSSQASKDVLMSNDQFAELLRSLGVDPPMKISPVTGREAYAFAKSDKAFTDLEEHPSLAVQTVVAARIGHKSTIEETRTSRLLSISQLQWPVAWLKRTGGSDPTARFMPMPLRYCGAHTGRLSGDWKLNVQNFPSRGKINHLKKALKAPPGSMVVNTDSSQIEARIVAWLANELDLLEQFEQGKDPYKIFAARVFGIDVSQVTTEQRFLGKTAILGLGFGLGWVKFKAQVRVKSLEAIRHSGVGSELILDDHEALKIVNTYRSTYAGVPKLWKELNNAISILAGSGGAYSIGPCIFSAGKISLPNGLFLYYHNLHNTTDGWVYEHAGVPRRLYGGALLENIVQALARCIVMDAAAVIKRRTGMQLALQVHDALAYCVPIPLVTSVSNVMNEEMARRPTWAPNLPLASDLKWGLSYGECK